MQCGLHSCPRICHPGPCEIPLSEAELARREREMEALSPEEKIIDRPSCGHVCGQRLDTCEHKCQAPCHPGTKCPPRPCNQKSKVTCECGRLSAEVPCVGLTDYKLKCDVQCEIEKRNRRLADAFGKPLTPKYTDLLINFAKACPQMVLKLERLLETFVKTPDTPTTALPPMDRVQRQFVHEWVKFWGMDSESVDKPEHPVQRYVKLTKRMDTHIPYPSLSTVAGIAQVDPATAASSTLLIYDLHKGILTRDIHAFLNAFYGEYTLQWVDEANCLAIFKSPSQMHRAFSALQRGIYKVRPYNDLNGGPPVMQGNMAVLTPQRKQKARRPPSPPPTESAFENTNPFSVLDNDMRVPPAALSSPEGPEKSFLLTDVTANEANWDSETIIPVEPLEASSASVPSAAAIQPSEVVEDWTQLVDDDQPSESSNPVATATE